MADNFSEKDSLIGKTLGGKYEITKKIGVGGMATVYRATQVNLGREVALKIIHPNLVNDAEFKSRFYREARDLAALQHPNIVTVFDFGTEDGFHCISMEYLQGKNLAEVIHREGRLDELKIVKYIAPIADALNHLHEKGLIHRDIKSSNIFISSNDRAVLMDFGIAYHQDKTISLSGAILGTAEFMSPEQAKGEVIDGRSDIYSLGIVMYESITGRVPFYSDNFTSTLYKVVHEVPPPISEDILVSDILKNLVLSTLEKEKLKRPQDGSDIYDVLNSIISTSEINRRTIKLDPVDTGSNRGARNEKDSGRYSKVIKPEKIESEDKFVSKHKSPGTAPEKIKRKSKLVLFLILAMALIVMGVVWFTFNRTGEKSGRDINQLVQLASQAFSGNDYVLAHNYSLQVIAEDPGNVVSKQMMSDCMHRLSNSYINPSLVSIPGGFFVMGNNDGGEDERPQHQVRINPFLISKTEITNKQFVLFLNAFGCSGSGTIDNVKVIEFSKNGTINFDNGSFKAKANSEDLPVIGVTWTGANLFCKAFFGRLPTEAEWEYSALGGENYLYSGSNNIEEIAWYDANSKGQPGKVGTKKPNAFGLYDLSGNAWEWCEDFYDKSYYQRSTVQNPTGPKEGTTKVIRGGDFASSKESLVNKFRSNANIDGSSSDAIGFRICIPVN
jgi:serine/threonine protein kinase